MCEEALDLVHPAAVEFSSAMKNRKAIWLVLAAWEAVRFIILYTHAVLVLNPAFRGSSSLLILWFGSSQLAFSAAFFFIAYSASRLGAYRGLLALGKFLSCLPGAIYAISLVFLAILGETSAASLAFIGLVIVDIGILLFLQYVRIEPGEREKPRKDNQEMPDLQITKVEED
jgi:hypothetical protein